MKFGVREITDVVFKAKKREQIGNNTFNVGQPILYINSAKTSNLESSATSSYATGGKGNSRLIAWEGEKTMTFTVEDALISPIGFALLSGSGVEEAKESDPITIHKRVNMKIGAGLNSPAKLLGFYVRDYLDELELFEKQDFDLGCFATLAETIVIPEDSKGQHPRKVYKAGDNLPLLPLTSVVLRYGGAGKEDFIPLDIEWYSELNQACVDKTVTVDFYVRKKSGIQQLIIDAGSFGSNYYVEANTKFRRQFDGKDLDAIIVFPNVKIQSNFTFNMAATGDPSTFSFVMDAMPGKVVGKDKDVLCVIQIVDDTKDTRTYGFVPRSN